MILNQNNIKPKKRIAKVHGNALFCAPGMGNNRVVKDHYALGSRKR